MKINFCMVISLAMCSTLGAIAVFVPSAADAPLGSKEGVTVQVAPEQFYAFSSFSLKPTGSDVVINFAPYYYSVMVQWLNSDRTVLLADGKPLQSQAYAAVVYDDVLGGWRDISGIALANGVREWTAGPSYFVCSGVGAQRFLQSFRPGSSPVSVLYDQVPLGTTVFPSVHVATSFDMALITDPAVGVVWSKKVKQNQVLSVVANENIINSATTFAVTEYPNTLNTQASEAGGITVTFPMEGIEGIGAAQVNYVVPYADVYEVVGTFIPEGKKPFDIKKRPLPAERRTLVNQQFLVVPSAVPAATPSLLPSDKQFVAVQVGMVLAQYYVKVGSLLVAILPVCDTAGVPLLNQYIAWNGTVNPSDPAALNGAGSERSYIKVSRDKTKLLVKACSYFASTASADAALCLGNSVVDRANPTGFVVAADARLFKGQVQFYMGSLRALQLVTKEEITQNPYCVYPIALNLAVQRQRAYIIGNNNVVPVDFATSDGKLFHGLLAAKTDFFNKGQDTSSFMAPHNYYVSIPADQKFQLWYNVSGEALIQLPNDFSGSVITQMLQVSKEAFKLWPPKLADRLSEKAAPFVCAKKKAEKLGFFERIAAVFDPSAGDYKQVDDLKAYNPAVNI